MRVTLYETKNEKKKNQMPTNSKHRTQRIKVSHNFYRSVSTAYYRLYTFSRRLSTPLAVQCISICLKLHAAHCMLYARSHCQRALLFSSQRQTAYCSSLSAFIFFFLSFSLHLLFFFFFSIRIAFRFEFCFQTATQLNVRFLLVEQGWLLH